MPNNIEAKPQQSVWQCYSLRPGEKSANKIEPSDIKAQLADGNRLWIDILGPTREDTECLADTFGFHQLALVDVLNNAVRPKQEAYDDVLFTVLGAINLNPGEDALDTINLNMFLTEQYLVTAHCKPLKSTRRVTAALEKGRNWLARGTDHVYYRLFDGVVNRYLDILDEMEVHFDEIEYKVFKTDDPSVQEEIFHEKRRIAFLKRSIGPTRDALRELVYGAFEQISPETQTLLRDVLDHVMRIGDGIESFKELAAGLMDSYMSRISNRMNEVMKLMSIIATVMLPLSFLTGIFGMNFEVIPGLHFEYGFWVLCAFMGAMIVMLLWFFRRSGIL